MLEGGIDQHLQCTRLILHYGHAISFHEREEGEEEARVPA